MRGGWQHDQLRGMAKCYKALVLYPFLPFFLPGCWCSNAFMLERRLAATWQQRFLAFEWLRKPHNHTISVSGAEISEARAC